MSASFDVVARYVASQGEAETVRGLLALLAGASREEPGNLSYEVTQDILEPCRFVILESYTGADAFAAHRESEHFRAIGREQIMPRLVSRTVETVLRGDSVT